MTARAQAETQRTQSRLLSGNEAIAHGAWEACTRVGCPAIEWDGDGLRINPRLCVDCGHCQQACADCSAGGHVPQTLELVDQKRYREAGAPAPSETLPADPLKGDPDAPVKIIGFAELYCPYCVRHVWQTISQLEREYIDEGLVQYDCNLPAHGFVAVLAPVAGECDHQQDGFWPYHDALFEKTFPGRNLSGHAELDVAACKALAVEVGLEAEPFDACLDGYDARYQACLADYQACTEGSEP